MSRCKVSVVLLSSSKVSLSLSPREKEEEEDKEDKDKERKAASFLLSSLLLSLCCRCCSFVRVSSQSSISLSESRRD